MAGVLFAMALAAPAAHAGTEVFSVARTVADYRPFFGPAPIDRYWLWLLVPLVVGVAVVYRTIKSDDLSEVPRRAAYLTFQVGAFMLAAAVVLWVTLRLF